MPKVFLSLLLLLIVAFSVTAQTTTDTAALTKLLNEFLAGASRNDIAMHEKFWDGELIYTSAGGVRRDKAEIMKSIRSTPAPKPEDPKSVYTGEDVRIKFYGSTAVVAFRLVNTVTDGSKTYVDNFLNTGTFVKRKGKWSVVAWQATRMPLTNEEAVRRAGEAEKEFHKAFLNGDVKSLESVTDENFVWTLNTGRLIPRKALAELLGSGKLKYSKVETRSAEVRIYGDTAVVRGISLRQHTSYPDGTPPDKEQLETFYTITLANRGGVFKVVAMQTGRN